MQTHVDVVEQGTEVSEMYLNWAAKVSFKVLKGVLVNPLSKCLNHQGVPFHSERFNTENCKTETMADEMESKIMGKDFSRKSKLAAASVGTNNGCLLSARMSYKLHDGFAKSNVIIKLS